MKTQEIAGLGIIMEYLKNIKMDKKILIIGGLGFIGKNLYLELLKKGYETIDIFSFEELLLHDPFAKLFINKLFIGSIEDSKLLEKIIPNYNVVFSLAGISGAAQSFKSPIQNIDINLKGHINILQACAKSRKKIKVVFISSRLVYGPPNYLPVDEMHAINPQSIYAIHKFTAENYYLQYSKMHNIDSIVLRVSNPYGPYQSFKNHNYGILNNFIYKGLTNKKISIYGDGSQKRDFIYIKDLVQLMEFFVKTDYGTNIFNVGAKESVQLIQTVTTLCKIIPALSYENVPWPEMDKKIETGDYQSDITKIVNLINWKPDTSLESGLIETINFYKKYIDFYDQAYEN